MKERVIRRYSNRKMYDMANSQYVSLSDLADIIRSGDSIRVTSKNGDTDYTAHILQQIILDQSKESGRVSVSTLHEWVRVGESFLDHQLEELRMGIEYWVKEQASRLFKGLRREDIVTLKKKVINLEKKINQLEKP
ncbi:MAG: polyhydroxyalkanoate synthesis regulator DNA-binding domain-containing protein [Balneolales bacterium]